jgi:hypothetical protein
VLGAAFDIVLGNGKRNEDTSMRLLVWLAARAWAGTRYRGAHASSHRSTLVAFAKFRLRRSFRTSVERGASA